MRIEVSESRRTEKDERLRFNCGYLFLEKLYHRRNKSFVQNKPTAQNEPASENSLNSAFTNEELVRTLHAMELHKVSGFGTDSEFISKETMKKLLKGLKEE